LCFTRIADVKDRSLRGLESEGFCPGGIAVTHLKYITYDNFQEAGGQIFGIACTKLRWNLH
jgi:hypothetical protein